MGYVYAVYLNKSFSKAAEELYISQPALSAAIKKVEKSVGLPLFDRSSNPVKLTAAGEYYIESIEKIMEIEEDMRGYFNRFLNNNNKTINVGGSSFFCAYTLPTIVQEFNREFPDFTVNLMEANADDLVKGLRAGIFDIIVDVEKRDPKMFGSVVWAEEQIVLAVPKDYEINNKLEKFRLTFEEVERGKFLGESYIYVYVNHSGVVGMEAMLLEYEKTQEQRKQIIPATDALMIAMNTILQENEQPISIKNIEIGYYFSPTYYKASDWKEIESGTAFPSWKITIQNGKTYFIEAYKN